MNEEVEKLVNNLVQAAMNKATYCTWDSRGARADLELAKAKTELIEKCDEMEACYRCVFNYLM